MKSSRMVWLVCLFALAIQLICSDSMENDDVEDGFTVEMLLSADSALRRQRGENRTGLSIRLTSRQGNVSDWHRLIIEDPSISFGQKTFVLSENSSAITSFSLRIDQADLANVSMPYYLCLHGEHCHGCAYVTSSIGVNQTYFLRDSEGELL